MKKLLALCMLMCGTINGEHEKELFNAIQHGKLDLAKLYIDNGAGLNGTDQGEYVVLMLATHKGNLELVQYLVKAGANVNIHDSQQRTALMIAARDGNLNILQYLIEKGAKVNATDENGNTALIFATLYKNLYIIKELVEHRANLEAKYCEENEKTPLMIAAENGSLNILQYLITQGANVHATDDTNWTALHYAAHHALLKATKYLIENGADVNAKDNLGYTPLYEFSEKGYLNASDYSFAKYLVENGAEITQKIINALNHPNQINIQNYLILAKEYEDAREADREAEKPENYDKKYESKVPKLLNELKKEKKFNQIDDLFAIALGSGTAKDLDTFHNFDREKYFNLLYQLEIAEQEDLFFNIASLLAGANINAQEMLYIIGGTNKNPGTTKEEIKTLDDIKKIFEKAKNNNHKSFGRAMLDYTFKIAGTNMGGKYTPKEEEKFPIESNLAQEIMQFHTYTSKSRIEQEKKEEQLKRKKEEEEKSRLEKKRKREEETIELFKEQNQEPPSTEYKQFKEFKFEENPFLQ